MISTYNRSQVIKAVFLALAGVVCYLIAGMFFKYGLSMIFGGFHLPEVWIPWLLFAALMVISWSGYHQWQQGDGFKTYIESSLFHDLGDDSASAVWTDNYARRVTGPAYIVSQVCLGGPLFLLKALKHIQQRLTPEPELEARLQEVLTILRAANKWQAIVEYPQHRREILMLTQMRQIDFSAHKGIPRIKALLPTHGI
jgi:hypothetical protein